MFVSHKIALNANEAQEKYFSCACGVARFAYNWALSEWEKQYSNGKRPSAFSLNKLFNSIKAKEFPWAMDVTKSAAQRAIYNLGDAFSNYFNGCGYPSYKKKWHNDSFRVDNGTDARRKHAVQVNGLYIYIPKLGWVRMSETLRFPGRIVSAVVSRTASRWFVSITVDAEWTPKPCESQTVVGVDLGVKALATLSNDITVEGPKALQNHLKKLKRFQRSLSRKKKGSRNRHKAKMKVARLHARISNIRKDSLHKLTHHLTTNYGVVCIEDLNVRGMIKNHNLARAVSDMGFFEFKRQLTYKAQWRGVRVVVADRWFPSSKTCSECGHVVDKLPLSIREWACPSCGVIHDRDVNAAKNLASLAAGNAVTACGEESSGPKRKRRVKLASVKQEFSSNLATEVSEVVSEGFPNFN